MKIAVVHNLPSGGAKRSTYELVRELASRGHTLYEFTKSTADLEFCPLKPYVKETVVDPFEPIPLLRQRVPLATPYIHLAQNILNLRRLENQAKTAAARINSDDFDLAFVQDCRFVLKPFELRHLSVPSVFFCRHGVHHSVRNQDRARSKRTFLQTLKDAYYGPAHGLHRQMLNHAETRNIRSASLVLTNSHFTRQLLLQHCGVSARVVYNGVDIETFKPLPVSRDGYVITVGALIHRKGYQFLIPSLGLIPARERPELLIVANTVDAALHRQLQLLADSCGVNMSVRSIFNDEELVELYNRAQAFVCSPHMEPFGTVILEAMACGTPVIAVNEGGAPEIIIDGVTGVLADRNETEFADAVQRVLGDVQLQSRLRVAALERVKQYWTWAHATDDLEREFACLLSSQPVASHVVSAETTR